MDTKSTDGFVQRNLQLRVEKVAEVAKTFGDPQIKAETLVGSAARKLRSGSLLIGPNALV